MIKGVGMNGRLRKIVCTALAAALLCTSVDVSAFASESIKNDNLDIVEKYEIMSEDDESTDVLEEEGESHNREKRIEDSLTDNNEPYELEMSGTYDRPYPRYSGGNGTESNPFRVSSYSDLLLMREYYTDRINYIYESYEEAFPEVEEFGWETKYFKLTEDIYFPSNESWDPIPCSDISFDGNGKTFHNVIFEAKEKYLNEYGNSNISMCIFDRAECINNLTIDTVTIRFPECKSYSVTYYYSYIFASHVETMSNCSIIGTVNIENENDTEKCHAQVALFAGSIVQKAEECNLNATVCADNLDNLYGLAVCCGNIYDCHIYKDITMNKGNFTGFAGGGDPQVYDDDITHWTIEKCSISKGVSIVSDSGSVYGFIVAGSYDFLDCSNGADITAYEHAAGFGRGGAQSVFNCVNTGNITSSIYGAVGFFEEFGGNMFKCRNTGNITGNLDCFFNYSYTAGFVGDLSGTLIECINEGDIFGHEAGGIAGTAYVLNPAAISKCINAGKVSGYTIGGISGTMNGTIELCQNKGEIKYLKQERWDDVGAGGIVGRFDEGKWSEHNLLNCYNSGDITGVDETIMVGGLMGSGIGTVKNCYNIGKINGQYGDNVGGVAGKMTSALFYGVHCLYDESYEAIGNYDYDGILVNTYDELKRQETFSDWDFDSVWEMGYGEYPYPILQYESANIHKISLDANGGTVNGKSRITLKTDSNGILRSMPHPKYSGKRFIGWYTSADGGDKIDANTVFAEERTIYAHWGEYIAENRVEIIPVSPAAGEQGVSYLNGSLVSLTLTFETAKPVIKVDPNAGSFRIVNKETGNTIYESGSNSGVSFKKSSKEGGSIICFTMNSGFEPSTEYYVEIEDGFLVFEDESLYAYTDDDDWYFKTEEKRISVNIELPNSGNKEINFRNDMFSQPAGMYSSELSELSACLSCMVYECVDEDDTNESEEIRSEYYEHRRIAEQFQKLDFDTGETVDVFISKHFFEDPTGRINDEETRGNYSPSWIVHKTIEINGEDTDLFWVVIRGTYQAEWIDNFDPGTGDVHRGFNSAADYIKGNLDKYISAYRNPNNKMKILVTGHSRGAAVANILGKKLDDERTGDKENIYVYTYASPNVAKYSETIQNKYYNIFNIVNPEDFVTKVLLRKWGYSRYGVTYVLPSRSIFVNEDYPYKDYDEFLSDVQARTRIYIGEQTSNDSKEYREYTPYKGGMKEVTDYVNYIAANISDVEKYYSNALGFNKKYSKSSKSGMNYCESSLFALYTKSLAYYLSGFTNRDIGFNNLVFSFVEWDTIGVDTTHFFVSNQKIKPHFGSAHTAETYMAMLDLVPVDTLKKPKYYNEVRVSCPVDVTVKDKDGNVIGQVTDKIITKTTNELAMEVEGDSKSFFIHEGADYKIELVGNDTGTMDYTIVKYDADAGEIERVIYQDVPLEKGTAYTQDLHGYESAEETPLFDEKSQVVKKSLELTEDDLGKLSISVNVIGNGNATSYESVTPGDYVMLTASPDIGNEFDGWYDKDGNLISSDDKFGLSVKKSEELTAKFKEMEGIVASPIDPQTYAGVALAPVIELYDGSGQLTPGTDYTVTYKNNKNAYTFEDADKLTDAQKKKAPQAIIKMKGNYSGQKVLYFCINPLSINDEAAFEASVKKGKKTVIFKYNDKALKENVDYTVGSVTDEAVTVTGKGNFTGTHEFPLKTKEGITNISMSKVIVDSIPTQFYTGTALTVDTLKGKDGSSSYAVKVSYPKGTELTAGKDYMVAKIYNSVNAGTATVVLKGLKAGGTAGASDKYSFTGEKRIKFKINQCPMDRVVVTGSDESKNLSAVYRKSGAKPEKLMVAIDGRTLKEGRDYTVKYSANTKYTGTGDKSAKDGKLTVTGRGNYKGSKSVVFTITRRPFTKEAGINVNAADMPYVNKAGKFMSDVKVYDSEGKLLKAGTDYEKVIKYVAADGSELSKASVPEEGNVITVIVTGKGGYTSDTISADYKILKAGEVNDISKAKISIDPVAYRSGRVILTGDNASCVHASMGKDKKSLSFSTDGIDGDFMVLPGSYENNDKKGTAKVTFVGINNYSGSKTVTVKIGTRSLMDWWRGYFY